MPTSYLASVNATNRFVFRLSCNPPKLVNRISWLPGCIQGPLHVGTLRSSRSNARVATVARLAVHRCITFFAMMNSRHRRNRLHRLIVAALNWWTDDYQIFFFLATFWGGILDKMSWKLGNVWLRVDRLGNFPTKQWWSLGHSQMAASSFNSYAAARLFQSELWVFSYARIFAYLMRPDWCWHRNFPRIHTHSHINRDRGRERETHTHSICHCLFPLAERHTKVAGERNEK